MRRIDAKDHVASVVQPIAAALRRSKHNVDGRFSFDQDDISPEEDGLSEKKATDAEDMKRSRRGSVGQKESLDVTDADTNTLTNVTAAVLTNVRYFSDRAGLTLSNINPLLGLSCRLMSPRPNRHASLQVYEMSQGGVMLMSDNVQICGHCSGILALGAQRL